MKRRAGECPHTPPDDDPLDIFEDPIQPEGPGDTGGAGEPGDSEVVDAPDGPDEIDSKLFDSMKRELAQMDGGDRILEIADSPRDLHTGDRQ